MIGVMEGLWTISLNCSRVVQAVYISVSTSLHLTDQFFPLLFSFFLSLDLFLLFSFLSLLLSKVKDQMGWAYFMKMGTLYGLLYPYLRLMVLQILCGELSATVIIF